MANKFMVLYSDIPIVRPTLHGSLPRAVILGERQPITDAQPPKLTIETLTRKQSMDVRNDPTVRAMARVLPMKLIKPVAKGRKVTRTPSQNTWGIEATGAHNSTFTGAGIVIAVLDTGIDATHPAFVGVNLVQKDFTGEGNGDMNGHGTHCAGTIFGRDVGGGRIGVARGVTKALIGKVLGEKGGGSSDMIVDAIQWAIKKGAHVISMSLGIDFPGYVKELQDEGYPTEMAASIALEGYRSNVLLFESLADLIRIQSDGGLSQSVSMVAAAGNESQRNVRPDFEIAVSPPAVSEGFLSVGALGKSGKKWAVADFSNTGAVIAGPGVDILSARAGGGLIEYSGTSMATPYVAGIAALWAQKLQAEGQFNRQKLYAELVANASTNTLAVSKAYAYGAGMVQAPV